MEANLAGKGGMTGSPGAWGALRARGFGGRSGSTRASKWSAKGAATMIPKRPSPRDRNG